MVIFPISIFSQIRSEGGGASNIIFFQIRSRGGGVIKNQIFPKFKIVQIILGGGGGVKKITDFFHNLWHFMFGLLPLLRSINWV